jgi:hypothetical protein
MLGLLGVATTGWAQVGAAAPGKLVVSAVGGLSAASGQSADSYKASYSLGGEADFTLAPQWLLVGTVAYNEALPKFTTSPDKVTVIEFGANIKYVVSATPVVAPYIRFGGGLYQRDVGSSASETNTGLNGGAGVDFNLSGSPLGLSVIARFHKVFITSTSFQTGDWQYFNLWGGVRLKVL